MCLIHVALTLACAHWKLGQKFDDNGGENIMGKPCTVFVQYGDHGVGFAVTNPWNLYFIETNQLIIASKWLRNESLINGDCKVQETWTFVKPT